MIVKTDVMERERKMKQCRQCGQMVDDNTSFCPNCGKKLTQPQNEKAAPTGGSRQILKAGVVPKKVILIQLVNMIVAFICMGIMFDKADEYSHYFGAKSAVKLCAILGIVFLVDMFANFLIIINYKTKLKVIATENRISGIASRLVGLLTESFDLPYTDVIAVSYKGPILVIGSRTKNYTCVVDDVQGFYKLIMEKSNLLEEKHT